ncbi:hypothetical protein F2Q70_00022720 [Brassica cretica]|uniref:Uncharacterized protein n=1 Tax=Brassica cretica TaxID=69181 RepID=A0A8S9GNS0_BRACR|nr:hypothetical protein F2Q70_00022720 [Brassica cretica]
MVELLLPNRELTCIEKPGIIHFNIVEAEFFGSHGPIDPVTAPRRKKGGVRGGVRAGTSAATQGESATPIYGPPRYHFTQRSTALPHGPLREAHEHIGNFGNLQRWNKAEGRTIFKLKTKDKRVLICLEKLECTKKVAHAICYVFPMMLGVGVSIGVLRSTWKHLGSKREWKVLFERVEHRSDLRHPLQTKRRQSNVLQRGYTPALNQHLVDDFRKSERPRRSEVANPL